MASQARTAATEAATAPALDIAKVERFVMERLLPDVGGTFLTYMVAIGDRLGLFKDLAAKGPATSRELAARAGIQERYAREWLSALASRGYVTFDPATKRFALPPEHAFVLATEGGPCSMAGGYQEALACLGQVDAITRAFREGGGVKPEAYGPDFWEGLERFTRSWFESYLVQAWLPAAPAIHAKLEGGASVADVGCGAGRAVVQMAKAFPRSRFVGFDVHGPSIERARALARREGVADRVTFQVLDAAKGLPGKYDVVTTFDVVHDAKDPGGILRAVRAALKPDGRYLMLEIRCADTVGGNANTIGTVLYGFSLFYCMTSSLAQGGEGLGTLGLPESEVRRWCKDAGFASVHRLPVEDAFNVLYEVQA